MVDRKKRWKMHKVVDQYIKDVIKNTGLTKNEVLESMAWLNFYEATSTYFHINGAYEKIRSTSSRLATEKDMSS